MEKKNETSKLAIESTKPSMVTEEPASVTEEPASEIEKSAAVTEEPVSETVKDMSTDKDFNRARVTRPTAIYNKDAHYDLTCIPASNQQADSPDETENKPTKCCCCSCCCSCCIS
ncbi:uncharacterized protein LOC119587740 [Penaeus monodon]|uniref:uncharacterized protein LOC119587740 n=1 Tax=Penaeus monodon TaxID=6687 RepID=UPI0018A75F82|nr:uncharacterized protein LOC119587740 [Penaeus monodon]